MINDSFLESCHQLRHKCYRVMYLWNDDDACIENLVAHCKEISTQADELLTIEPQSADEEAELCWTLLLCYNVIVRDDEQVNNVLNRGYRVLSQPLPKHLRCQLLTYMYGENHDHRLLLEVRQLSATWEKNDLQEEDNLMFSALTAMENEAKRYEIAS